MNWNHDVVEWRGIRVRITTKEQYEAFTAFVRKYMNKTKKLSEQAERVENL
jgi:hypothetical protein